jgi:SAM-dependent methyltransferase
VEERKPGLSFGEEADLYDRVRLPYPATLASEVLDYCGTAGLSALEVGAGTGRATAAIASHQVPIVALEPDPAMASLIDLPGVKVLPLTFEDFRPSERFGLLFSAEAWHWTAPATRWELARQALLPGGTIALFWNNEQIGSPSLRTAMVEVFATHAPTVVIRDSLTDSSAVWRQWPGDELAATDGFGSLESRHYLSRTAMPREDYLGLTRTRSQFRMLPTPTQEKVMAGLTSVFESFGAEVPLLFETTLLLAKRLAA